MEVARPVVDGYLLELLQARTFTRRDFAETARGVCRVNPPLSHELAETAPRWADAMGPAVEAVAEQLARSEGSRIKQLSTPLTGSNRSARYQRSRRRVTAPAARPARPEPSCKRCGGPVPRPTRTYCDDCLPHYQREQYSEAFHGTGLAAIAKKRAAEGDPTHGNKAATRRAKTNITRKRQAREWDERHGKLVDPSAFQREILPLIQQIPLSRLQEATGLSLRYVSLIRRVSGRRTRGIGRRSSRLAKAGSGLWLMACTPSPLYPARRTSAPSLGCLRTLSARMCRRAGRSRFARSHAVLGVSRTLLPAAPLRFSRSRGRCCACPPRSPAVGSLRQRSGSGRPA